MTSPTPRAALYGNPPSETYEPRKGDIQAVMEQLEMLAVGGSIKHFDDDLDDLPTSGNATGDLAVVLDAGSEGGVYRWSGSSWVKRGPLPLVLTESLSAQQAAEARDEAVEARDDAQDARDDAVIARTAAQTARTGAEAARDLAQGYRDQSMGFRDEAGSARDESRAYRDQANGYRIAASSSASAAELAAIAATADTFPNIAAGLAATSDGDTFAVFEGPLLRIYEHDGGTAALLGTLGTAVEYESRAAVELLTVPAVAQYVRVAGYAAPGDGGDALYRTVATEPSHPGKIEDASGRWFELIGDINVRQFGAVGDGAVDDTDAFSAAAARGGQVRVPAGTYRITETLTPLPTLFLGVGSGQSVLLFDNLAGADGIAYQPATTIGATGGLVGLELVARGSNGGRAVSMPKASNQYDTFFARWQFRDLYCRGTTRNTSKYSHAWDEGFATWFRLSDCVGLEFEHVVIQGQWDIKTDPAGQFEDCGIELDAASALLTARLANLTIGPVHTGIKIGAKSFFSLTAFDLIGTHDGIVQSGTTAFNEPKIWFGNINAQRCGIEIEDSDAREINSVTIRRHAAGWKGASHDWDGIKAINSSTLKISGCVIQPDHSGGAFAGTQTGILLVGCGSVILEGNIPGLNLADAIVLDNVAGAEVKSTTLAGAGVGQTFARLRNNARRINIDVPSISSTSASTAYAMLVDDGTVDLKTIRYSPRLQNLEGSNPFISLRATNAGADAKNWKFTAGVDGLRIQALNDLDGGTINAILIDRTGMTIDEIQFRAEQIRFGHEGPIVKTGPGNPEGTVAAGVGSLFLRTDSTAGVRLYVKESGDSTTGWVGK